MIRAWRIDKASRAKADAFSGEGSRIYAGRWNTPSRRVVYAASSLSLAALEKFVHLGEDGMLIRHASYSIDIPDGIAIREWTEIDLPPGWKDNPTPEATQARGDEWISSGESAILVLPSAITPVETNILINPAHADFSKLIISDPIPYLFDPRMWKKTGR